MTASQLQKEIRQVYLEMKSRGFTDIDDLIERNNDLQMKKFQMVAESGISGNEALRRMIEIRKQVPIGEDYREQYEFLSMIRKVHVKYLYDNNLVA